MVRDLTQMSVIATEVHRPWTACEASCASGQTKLETASCRGSSWPSARDEFIGYTSSFWPCWVAQEPHWRSWATEFFTGRAGLRGRAFAHVLAYQRKPLAAVDLHNELAWNGPLGVIGADRVCRDLSVYRAPSERGLRSVILTRRQPKQADQSGPAALNGKKLRVPSKSRLSLLDKRLEPFCFTFVTRM